MVKRARTNVCTLIGAPGSGKDSVASVLQDEHGYHVITISEALREQARRDSNQAPIIQALQERGQKVPDFIVKCAIENAIRENKGELQLLLNGFPRTLGQVDLLPKVLDRILQHHAPEIIRCRFLKVEEGVARDRVASRVKDMEEEGRGVRIDDISPEALEKRLGDYFQLESSLREKVVSHPRYAMQEIDASQGRLDVIASVSESLLSALRSSAASSR